MPQKLSRAAVARSAKTKARSDANRSKEKEKDKAKDKDKEVEKGKGKLKGKKKEETAGDMDVDPDPPPRAPIAETEEDERLRQLAIIQIPDPSRGLRRLPCTPRTRPRVSLTGEDDDDEDDDDEDDEEEEEEEEDRTIMAPLTHRFTHHIGTVNTVQDKLTTTFHTVEAHRKLLNVCGRLHMNIHPRELHAYYRSDGRVVGVLNDYDGAITSSRNVWYQMSDAQREDARHAARERERARRRAVEKLGQLRGGD